MGRLSNLQSGVDAVLTKYARSYTNQNLVYKHLAPKVSVSKVENRVPVFSKENMRLYKSNRALRSSGATISPDEINFVTFSTESKMLSYPVDEEEYDNSDYELDERAVRIVTDALELEREVYLANWLDNPANLTPAQVVTPAASEKWDIPTVDVIDQILQKMQDFRRAVGVYPTRAIISPDVLVALNKNDKFAEKVKYTQKYTVTTDLLSSMLTLNGRQMLDIQVGGAIVNSVAGVFNEDKAQFVGELNNDVWKKTFIMAYVPPTPSQYEPSFAYTFEDSNYPYIKRVRNEETATVKFVRRDKCITKVIGGDAVIVFRQVIS